MQRSPQTTQKQYGLHEGRLSAAPADTVRKKQRAPSVLSDVRG